MENNQFVKVSFFARSLAVILILFIIPGNYILKEVINEYSSSLIIRLQKLRNPGLDYFFRSVLYNGSTFTLIIVPPVIYNLYDIRRAVKQTLINCFGMYVYSIVALITKEPRPYWSDSKIKGIYCDGGYASPFLELFVAAVLYGSYSIDVFSRTRSKLKILAYIITTLIIITLAFGGIYLGSNYPQQIFITYCYTYVYLTCIFTFDDRIMNLTILTCFNYKKNRKNSIFYLITTFFLLFGAISVYSTITLSSEISIKWIKNANKDCGSSSVGGSDNFLKSAWIFYNLGVVFGCMMTSKVMSMFWWNTKWWKRIVRCVVSAGVSVGIFFLFSNL